MIQNESDLILLKKIVEENYIRFLNCVSFALKYKSKIGTLLDKLNNKKRAALQKKEAAAHKPNFVDFFAGAGGLSYGFLQSGFKVSFANDFEDVCIRTYR